MNREYTLRTDGESQFACLTRGDINIEVPATGNETDIQEQIDLTMLLHAMEKFHPSQARDDVYTNQVIVRQDHSMGTPEAELLVRELEEHFPDYADFTRSSYNIVGRYNGYREPYQNDSISWYDFQALPSEQLQLAFNTSYPNSNLKNWYGLKFDLITKKVMLKIVIKEYDDDVPELPYCSLGINPFYAITHYEDGTSSDWVDAYVYATPKRIREFCADKGLVYPLPENTHKECDVVWCWGFVFNKDTLEYGAVKGYARYNQ